MILSMIRIVIYFGAQNTLILLLLNPIYFYSLLWAIGYITLQMENMFGNTQKPTYKIQQLLQNTKKATSPANNPNHHNTTTSSHQNIKITSPFYPRDSCHHSTPCKCPFHPLKKHKYIPNIQRPQQNYLSSSLHHNKVKHPYAHICTQGNEGYEEKQDVNNKGKIYKNENRSSNSVMESRDYGKVGHKVVCRNEQFQDFLREKQLYILTGKLPNRMIMQQNEIFEQFEDYINKQMYFKTQYSYATKLDTQKDLRVKQFNRTTDHYPKNKMSLKNKIGPKTNFAKNINQFSKINIFVDMLVSGKKNMSLPHLKLMIQRIKKSIQAAKLKNSDIKTLKMLENCLVKMKQLIDKEEKQKEIINRKRTQIINSGVEDKQNRSIEKDKDNQRKQGSIGPSKLVKKRDSKAHKRQSFEQISYTKRRDSVSQKIGYKKSQKAERWKGDKRIRFQKMYEKNKSDQIELQKQRQQKSSHHQSNKEENNDRRYTSKKLSKYNGGGENSVIPSVKKSKLMKGRRKDSVSEYLSNKKFITQQNQFQAYLAANQDYKMSKFYNQSYQKPNRNGRSKNLKQFINCRTQADQNDVRNFEKLRKKIKNNRNFIHKIRHILEQLDLKDFVIEESDSLITKRKKIRNLSEMMPNNKSRFSSQLNRYLQLYHEHCSQILRKPYVNKNNEISVNQNIHGRILEKEQFDFEIHDINSANKSLKFIDLTEPEEEIRQTKGVNWISIPQFTTNECKQKNKIKTILHKINQVTTIPEKKTDIDSNTECQDDLIQTELSQKFTVQIPIMYTDEPHVETKKVEKDVFGEKIEGYRNLLLKKGLLKGSLYNN